MLHTLASLLLAAGIAHWHLFRPAPVIPKRLTERPPTAREHLQEACADLATALLDDIASAYGQKTARGIAAQLGRQAQTLGWSIGFAGQPVEPGSSRRVAGNRFDLGSGRGAHFSVERSARRGPHAWPGDDSRGRL